MTQPYVVVFETEDGRSATAIYWVEDEEDGRRQAQEYLAREPSVHIAKVNGKDV
jgi:hypothetical protein